MGSSSPGNSRFARFLFPAIAGYTAFAALAAFFHEQFGLLKLFFFKGHVVICGLGRKGDQLAKDFLNSGYRVVVIELDDDNDEIRGARADGAVAPASAPAGPKAPSTRTPPS